MTQGPQDPPQGGPQPVVVQVQRPATRDLGASSDRAIARLGAAVTALLSIGGAFGAVVKTYHLVHAHEAQIAAHEKTTKRLERKVSRLNEDLEMLCAEHFSSRECYAKRRRLGGAPDDE